MGLIIWYQLTISETGEAGAGGLLSTLASAAGLPSFGLPLTVSNDVFGGSLILDADITVTMTEGASADTFEIGLTNLPGDTIALIRAKVAVAPLDVEIHLGYFDEPETTTGSRPVMRGRVTGVVSSIGDDGLTRIKLTGQERGGYLLRTTDARVAFAGATTATAFANALVQKAGLALAPGSALDVPMENFTLADPNALSALQTLADLSTAPLVVRDGSVLVGPAVGAATDPAPVAFDPEHNVVFRGDGQAEQITVQTPDADAGTGAGPSARTPLSSTLDLVVLGHPGLRVGQVATLRNLDDVPAGPLRLAKVEHRFGVRSGYVCKVTVVAAAAGRTVQSNTGVQALVDRVHQATQRAREANPAVDVGDVSSYASGADGKHLASLHYGQNPASDVLSPSVATPVRGAELYDKPVSSPFAFGSCGLVIPVYPGMRALLAHNRGLVNDAVVAGFLWPGGVGSARPANRPGDYWLALPTELGGDGLPSGKAVNDLTDASGYRVLQARGLHILVGGDALPDVGTRPDPPTDATVTVEHQSGTTIVIGSDGAVTITTNNKPIKLDNGGVTLTLDGAAVKVA